MEDKTRKPQKKNYISLMKKLIFLSATFLLSGWGFGQISGKIIEDGRKLVQSQELIMNGHVNGKIVFQISVDAKGEITSAKILEGETTIKSTPAKIEAYNYIKKFQFEPGTWFPKYHQGKIEIEMKKSGNTKQ